MKKGDKLLTPHGVGTIVDIEHYSRPPSKNKRYGVKLKPDKRKKWLRDFIPIPYYFGHEVKLMEGNDPDET